MGPGSYEGDMNNGSGPCQLVLKAGNTVVQRTPKSYTEIGEAEQIVALIKAYMNEIAKQIQEGKHGLAA